MVAGAAPVWNGNDERRSMLSTTTGNGSRVDDDDVSATVTISRRRSLDEALTMAGAAPVWNGNDERRSMLSTTTGNGNGFRTLTTMTCRQRLLYHAVDRSP
jgi:hypothetical protein